MVSETYVKLIKEDSGWWNEWEERWNTVGHVFITVEAGGELSPQFSVLSSLFLYKFEIFHNTKQTLSCAIWTVKLTHHLPGPYQSLNTCSLVLCFLLAIKPNISFSKEFSHFSRNLLLFWVSTYFRHSSMEENIFRNFLLHENKSLQSLFSV